MATTSTSPSSGAARNDRGTERVRDVSLVIAPRYQVSPLRRATTTYSPMDPARVRLSSQVVGTVSNQGRPGQFAGLEYLDGLSYQKGKFRGC